MKTSIAALLVVFALSVPALAQENKSVTIVVDAPMLEQLKASDDTLRLFATHRRPIDEEHSLDVTWLSMDYSQADSVSTVAAAMACPNEAAPGRVESL